MIEPNQPDIDKFIEILSNTPRRLVSCTIGVRDSVLHEVLSGERESASEILAHLRVCEELSTYNIYAILAKDNPSLIEIDDRKLAKVTRYDLEEFQHSFNLFVMRRSELIKVLQNLPFQDWSRSADIGGSQQTVFNQVRQLAFHELGHVEQIEALFNCHA